MHDSVKADLTPFPPTPFIIMGAPKNHANIPLICLVVFPILVVFGRCVHTAMFKVVGPEDCIFPVSLAESLHHKGSSLEKLVFFHCAETPSLLSEGF